MGLIKNIVGGIFSLIGGIFGAIGGIFGLGKKSEFFMELDEATQPITEAVNQVVSDQPAKSTKQASESSENSKKAEEAPVDAAAPVAVAKKQPQKQKAAFKEQIPATPDGAAQTNPAKKVGTAEAEMPQVPNFATDYLVNPKVNFSPRRRPGPSLSPFKEMAKQVGRRSASMS